MTRTQAALDAQNAAFWDELCGTSLARELGITEISPDALRRFDAAYLDYYPYFAGFLPGPSTGGALLEIGLGFGTGGQMLAERGFGYHGLDIAAGPVQMMRYRLEQLGLEGDVRQGSVLELPFEDASFDRVVSIGCLHHTGDIPGAVAEVTRVLRPGGGAHVMLYNRHSWRQLRIGGRLFAERVAGRRRDEHEARGISDRNLRGETAPMVDFVSRREARELFAGFRDVRISAQNFDPLVFARGRLIVPRDRVLGNIARLLGLDLYITAIK